MKKDNIDDKYYEGLRIEVWKRVIGNESIDKGNHYYDQIAKQIKKETGEHLNKDTIRNFFERKHLPQPKTLDIYSSFVLGATEDSQKTFKDFQNWYNGRSIFSQLNDFFSQSKNRYHVLLGGIFFIIVLISIVLYNQNNGKGQMQTLHSTIEAVSSSEAAILQQELPSPELVRTIFSSFPFDSLESTSIVEAQRMLEWLGVGEIKINVGNGESFLSGTFPTGCSVTIWPNHEVKNDTYDFRFFRKKAIRNFDPFYFKLSKPKSTVPFFKRFYNSNLTELKEDGWFLSDSVRHDLWGNPKYENTGYLTMETLLGDSNLDNEEYSPKIINVLAHSINCGDCCEITIKVVDFNPYQRYQQANVFFFYSDKVVPSLKFSYDCGRAANIIQAFFRDHEYKNTALIPFDKFQERSKISHINNSKIQNLRTPETKIDSLILKLKIEKQNYFFSYKTNRNAYIPLKAEYINYPPPKYIGLAACQGRPDIPFPIYPVADTIPVHFEYVRLKKCD